MPPAAVPPVEALVEELALLPDVSLLWTPFETISSKERSTHNLPHDLEPSHSLQERRFLAKLLLRIRDIRSHAEAVIRPRIQSHLVRRARVLHDTLELRPFLRRQEIVGFF